MVKESKFKYIDSSLKLSIQEEARLEIAYQLKRIADYQRGIK